MQARPTQKASSGANARQAKAVAAAGLALLAAACSDSQLALDTPIDWWHQLQGGAIAQDRPPPPGAADPYPNFARIPPKPTPIDPATRRALIDRYAAERDRTERQAAQDPIVWPVPGAPTSPAAPAANPPPNAPAVPLPSSSVTLAGATPPPAPPSAPPPRADFTIGAPVASGPVPPLPDAAPALPSLPGLPIDTPVPVVERPRPSQTVRFAAGSAALPTGAEATLRTLVARRAGGAVAITAGGEANSPALDVQRAALQLAIARTGAIKAALRSAGVPDAAIRAEATAQGRDGIVRLLD